MIALFGTLVLMVTFGYGISMDVENLRFAVLDRDQTMLSRNYALDLGGSRYFIAQSPISDYDELDRRMRSGELSLALEIPPNFARDIERGDNVKIGAWIDGAMRRAPRMCWATCKPCIRSGCRSRRGDMPRDACRPDS